ncbi:MAG: hypothetical protein IKM91_03210, partial [Candidatus Methanomethylophilaceae archaeon]|nr:hypothetical protein [Candidatus Methanomethylophilaceae archaeon]
GDVVGVGELEGVVVHLVDLFDLAGHYVLHGTVIRQVLDKDLQRPAWSRSLRRLSSPSSWT